VCASSPAGNCEAQQVSDSDVLVLHSTWVVLLEPPPAVAKARKEHFV